MSAEERPAGPPAPEAGAAPGARRMRIRTYPDEILKRVAAPVRPGRFDTDEELRLLAASMARTMLEERGVGLAAPQVGVPLRLVVLNSAVLGSPPRGGSPPPGGSSPEEAPPLLLVNPEIVSSSGREVGEEGCLSVPGVNAKVRRRLKVTVEYDALAGGRTGIDLEGLAARVAQHEIDHLDGTLFVDRLGPAGRLAVRRALAELRQRAGGRK